MRVAALYDIHGNLPALEPVLEEVRRAGVDLIVVGGDVFPGPMANECLRCLLESGIPTRFIRGNGEREVLAVAAGSGGENIPEQYRATMLWESEHLEPMHRQELEGWPATILLAPDEALGEVLFCHATPRSDTELFTRETPEERVLAAFAGVTASVVVCGHTHMPFDRIVGRVRVVNAGSVGMPFGERGADWLLLGPDLEFRHTNYDAEAAAGRIRSTSFPNASDFALRNVVQPPSAQEMVARFEAAAARAGGGRA